LLGTDKYFFSGESNLLFVVFVPTNVARKEAEGWSLKLETCYGPKRGAAYEATADVAGGDVELELFNASVDVDEAVDLLKFTLLGLMIYR
jgi:hypothetical protein